MSANGRPLSHLLTPEVIDYLHHGLIMFLATCDQQLRPESTLASGVRVVPGGTNLTVFVPRVLAATTLDNLRAHSHLALTMSRVTDDRSLQIKGRYLGDRAGDDIDAAFLEPILIRRTEAMAAIGMPRSVARRMAAIPTVAIDMEITQLYEQTPGPRAGRPLEAHWQPGDLP